MNRDLTVILEEFQNRPDIFMETELGSALKAAVEAGTSEWIAESVAFNLAEGYPDEATGWGTYYGPLMVSNGQEFPSHKDLTGPMLTYLCHRSHEVTHPVMKIRYADVVWDLQRLATDTAPPVSTAQTAIDATLELVKLEVPKYPRFVAIKLERALSIAISINDKGRLARLVSALLEFDERTKEDENAERSGVWMYPYRLLISNKKIRLEPEVANEIVQRLETRFESVSDISSSSLDPHSAADIADMLIEYYRSREPGQVEALADRCRDTFLAVIETKQIRALQATAWLDDLRRKMLRWGFPKKAEALHTKVQEQGARLQQEMGTVSHEFTISKEDIRKVVDEIVKEDPESSLTRIQLLLPRRDRALKQIEDGLARTPLIFDISRVIVDRRGVETATISPFEEDEAGHLVHQIAQHAQLNAVIWLKAYFDEVFTVFESLRAGGIESYLCKSLAFPEEYSALLKAGFKSYFEREWIQACSVLVPCVEAGVRNLVEAAGGNLYKLGRGGAQRLQLRTLDDLLRDEMFKYIWEDLREDIPLYLRVLLTDQRGLNLRNRLCHGDLEGSMFCEDTANMVVQALLVLGLVRRRVPDDVQE